MDNNNNDMFSNPLDEDNLEPIEDDNSGRNFVWLILGVAAIGCGILFAAAFFFFQPDAQSLVDKYFPSPTATSTSTPNMTATQQVIQSTATAGAIQTTIAEAGSQWNVVLFDEFTKDTNIWTVGNDDDTYAKIIRTIKNGSYEWDATSKKGFVAWIRPDATSVTDFFLSAHIQRIEGTTNSDYGVTFREDSKSNFYYFGVDDSNFHVSLSYDNEWIDVVEWTPSSAILASAQNQLTVIAEGSHFIFLINDQVVAEAVDTHLPKGTVGLAIQIYEPELKATFEFDNFELRIPTPPATPTPKIITTPTITPTAHVLLEPPQAVVILEDRFDENTNKWDRFYVTTSIDIRDGKMYMKSNNRDVIGLSLCWGCPLFEDTFYFQAELVLAEDSTTGYGLAFCTTGIGNNYYIFQIQPADQTFSLDQSTTDGWRTLVSMEDTNLINAYPNTNTLAVFFDKGRMDLYINGSLATSYVDPSPPYCRRTGVYINGGLVDLIVDNAFAYDIK